MTPIGLAFALLVALALRLLFIGLHLSNISSLWADYERRGLKFRIAQSLDWTTLIGFAIPACVLLYNLSSLSYPLITTFVGFLGIQLLSRLQASSFPRTNLPGAFSEAKINLLVHLLMSFMGAAGVTLLAAIYLWWHK